MFKQGPSTSRERETLLLLREALPEYEINPHMRLANVVKGRLAYTRAMGQYEMDFVVQNPDNGDVVCAIELDDSTHDTDDGRRRDGNKNRWMAQARIPLIRIRQPDEARTIRERVNQPIDFNIPDGHVYSFEKKELSKKGTKIMYAAVITVVFGAFVFFAFNSLVTGIGNTIKNNAIARQQQNLNQQIGTSLVKQPPEAEQSGIRGKVNAQPAHYERVLIRGKSARECSYGGVINNTSVECMKDRYENVWVSGNP